MYSGLLSGDFRLPEVIFIYLYIFAIIDAARASPR